MYTIKFKRVFKILFVISLSFVLCACQMDSAESVELSSQMEYIQDFDNKYSKALNACSSGRYPDDEISEEEWHEIADPMLALRTDLIPWAPWPESPAGDQASETLTWLGESRNDGWRCEGACVDPDGISCDSFLVRMLSPEGSTFQEISLSAKSRTMPTGWAHWEDVNFDGEPDVLVHLGGGRGGTQGYAAVLWDETMDGYREEPVYEEIGNPVPDPEH